MHATGFAPVAHTDAHTLILGSLPGLTSLRQQQYYAHPHNSFWRLLAALYDIPTDWHYAQRCDAAMRAGLAIWDVCHAAQRAGSLDSAIAMDSVIANDIPGLLTRCPAITTIGFNGQAAARLFRHHIPLSTTIRLVTLPSSSPAHASLSFEQKLACWRQALFNHS